MNAQPMTHAYDELLRSRYGPYRPQHTAAANDPGSAGSPAGHGTGVALAADTGAEVLPQAPAAPPALEEYVVDRPEPPLDAEPGDVSVPPVPASAPETTPGDRASEGTAPAHPQAPPPPAAPAAPSGGVAAPQPAPQPAPPTEPAVPLPGTGYRDDAPALQAPAPQEPPAISEDPGHQRDGSRVSEDDLAADMQAILSGKSTFNPATGAVEARSSTGADRPPSPPPELPAPGARKDAEIFDRIAMSLEHANSFDLGTVQVLRNQFDSIDRNEDRKRALTAAGSVRSSGVIDPPPGPHRSFVEDLGAIERERAGAVAPVDPRAAYRREGPWSGLPGRDAACGASSLALGVAPDRSVAMYDTGEHVLAAGDLYPDQLVVGSGSGVAFSYGQIVAMPDFFGTVDDLRSASPTELGRLKALIVRNTEYYRSHRRNASGNISNSEWDQATGGRYLTLAESNYDHFSPAALVGMSGGGHRVEQPEPVGGAAHQGHPRAAANWCWPTRTRHHCRSGR